MDRDLALEALVQAIPHVGGPIATLYFGNKSKKQFQRLKNFYEKLSKDLDEVKSSISPISEHSQDELVDLIEEIHDKIENERVKSKRKYYRNLYKKSLIHPVETDNFNERKYFIDIISRLSEPHFKILTHIFKKRVKISVNSINIDGIEESLKKGFVQQLENYGLISLELENIQGFSNQISINKKTSITKLGSSFHYFCLIG